MITIFGNASRHCDGVTRRQALLAGALGLGGLTLAELLRAEAAAGVTSSTKAVINIHLDGGPPQMDMIAPKPDAPAEIRGEFKPIATRLPGVRVCELMPKLAGLADKVALVRGLVGSVGVHDAFQCQSGFSAKDLQAVGGRPALGSVVARLRGSARDVMPAFVDLMQGRPLVRNSARPGFLGPSYQQFRPDLSKMFARELEPGMKTELAARGAGQTERLTLVAGLTPGRARDRANLLADFDKARRNLDRSGAMEALDHFSLQALNILTSGRFAEAMDLGKEPAKVVARYTPPADPGATGSTPARTGRRRESCSWRAGSSRPACAASASRSATSTPTPTTSRALGNYCRSSITPCTR